MATNKTDRAFKTLVNLETTDENKLQHNEFGADTINVHADDIWALTIAFNDPAQAVIDGAATAETLNVLTEDLSVPNSQSWRASNSEWISTKFGENFVVRLFDGSDNEIFPTDPLDWFFDYQTGILTFNGTLTRPTPLKITGWRYTGPKGAGGAPGGADTQIQFNNSGVFGGAAGVTWNSGTNTLSIASVLTSPGGAGARSEKYGAGATVSGDDALAIGNSAIARQNCVVIGSGSSTIARDCIVIGQNIIGVGATVGADFTIAIGNNIIAAQRFCTVIGHNASVTGIDCVAIGANASTINNSGIAIGRSAQAVFAAVAIGNAAVATTGVAIGSGSIVNGGNSVAIGDGANATTGANIAIGRNAIATGSQAITFGDQASTTLLQGYAIGSQSSASSRFNIAVGHLATVSGTAAQAYGCLTSVTGSYSIGIGHGASIIASSEAIAVGHNASVIHARAGAIGENAVSTAIQRITIGVIGVDPNDVRHVQISGGLSAWGAIPPASQPTISGSRSGATVAVLTALLTALDATGIIIDGTTA